MRQFATDQFEGGKEGDVFGKKSNKNLDLGFVKGGADIPSGGDFGDVLTKFPWGMEWQPVPKEIPSGGNTGDVLTKSEHGVEWKTPEEESEWEDHYEISTFADLVQYLVDYMIENNTNSTPEVDFQLNVNAATGIQFNFYGGGSNTGGSINPIGDVNQLNHPKGGRSYYSSAWHYNFYKSGIYKATIQPGGAPAAVITNNNGKLQATSDLTSSYTVDENNEVQNLSVQLSVSLQNTFIMYYNATNQQTVLGAVQSAQSETINPTSSISFNITNNTLSQVRIKKQQ